jgi:hypothetical protein
MLAKIGYASLFFLFLGLGFVTLAPGLLVNNRLIKTYKLAILPICNSESPCDNTLPKKIEQAFFKDKRSVTQFIKEASDGRIEVSGKVLAWLKPVSPLLNSNDVISRKEELVNLAAKLINLKDYDVFYLYTQTKGAGTQVGLPGQVIRIKDGEIIKPGIAYMVNSDISFAFNNEVPSSVITPSNSWAHELLHILGLNGHANSLRCKNTKSLKSCEFRAYGDSFSTMGEAIFSLKPNWSMKRSLSWAESSDIGLVTSDGVYSIDAHKKNAPRALEVYLPKAITLKPGVTFDRLFIEQRSNDGFDNLLDRLKDPLFLSRYRDNAKASTDGAFLYFAYQNRATPTTVLLDSHPNSPNVKKLGVKWPYNPGEMSDAILPVHESLSIFDSGLKVEVLSAAKDSLKVKISGF